MRSYLPVFFVLLYTLAMVRPVMPLLEYAFNEEYISEFLCINKADTKLNCNGRCYLVKKIKEQTNEQHPMPKIAMDKYPVGFVVVTKICVLFKVSPAVSAIINLDNLYSYLFLKTYFHPPNSFAE